MKYVRTARRTSKVWMMAKSGWINHSECEPPSAINHYVSGHTSRKGRGTCVPRPGMGPKVNVEEPGTRGTTLLVVLTCSLVHSQDV